MDTEKTILIASSVGFVALIITAILVQNDFILASNLIIFAIIFITVPYSIFKFLEFRRIKEYEREFPSFLRDLAESQRAGLTIIQSIRLSAKSDYGSLSKQIKRIDDQISWNVPLEKVLLGFTERMKKSRIITRSMMVIRQANRSGGKIEQTMESLAKNIEMLRDVQAEKSSLLNQQVMMMYAIFFIFLGISIALVGFLSPLQESQSSFGLLQSNPNPCAPCLENADITCVGCNTFFTVSTVFGFGDNSKPVSYYRSLFFTMIVVQAIFSGLISGQIASDSVAAGVKHSMILLLLGTMIFISSVRFDLI